jgi:excisionase family DNA binding protein
VPVVSRSEELVGEPTYSLAELAEVLGVHYQTARGWVLAGQIESFPVGRRRRVRKSAVERFCGLGVGAAPVPAPQARRGVLGPEARAAAVRAKYGM